MARDYWEQTHDDRLFCMAQFPEFGPFLLFESTGQSPLRGDGSNEREAVVGEM
jgi:hypothetical protein